MKANLKKLSEQVIVLTGASSGIGLYTVRMAAKQSAKFVLAARSKEALRRNHPARRAGRVRGSRCEPARQHAAAPRPFQPVLYLN